MLKKVRWPLQRPVSLIDPLANLPLFFLHLLTSPITSTMSTCFQEDIRRSRCFWNGKELHGWTTFMSTLDFPLSVIL